MSKDYTRQSGSKVSFTLTIEEEQVKKEQKAVLENFRSQVAVKGFRKGHAPDEMVLQQIGPQRLSFESLNRAVDKAYREFIQTHSLRPVSQPKIDMKDPTKKPLQIECEVEVYPEVKIGDYKKIKMSPLKIDVKKEEITEVLTQIMTDMSLFKVVDRKAEKGDGLLVDFEGHNEKGEVLPSTDAKEVVLNLGSGQFLPDLEKGFEGMKKGEEKEVSVSFPKDYHAADMAGKKVPFRIKLHEVREVKPENLNSEEIEKIMGQKGSLTDLEKKVKEMIEKRKENEERKKLIGEYNKKLAKVVDVDLPLSWVEGDIEMRLREIKESPQFKNNPEMFWKAIKKTEEDLKKEFRAPAEENLKVFLALSHIVEEEKIELDKDELGTIGRVVEDRIREHPSLDPGEEASKTVLNMKIDKYFRGLTL